MDNRILSVIFSINEQQNKKGRNNLKTTCVDLVSLLFAKLRTFFYLVSNKCFRLHLVLFSFRTLAIS